MRIEPLMRTACAVAVIGSLLVAMPTLAQDGGPGHRRGHMMSPEERTEHLTKALNLSDDQKGKVLSALQDEKKQMDAVRSDSSLSREDRWSKMKEIHQNTNTQIKSTLTPDQAKQFDEMQQGMEEHREQGRNNNQGNSSPPQ